MADDLTRVSELRLKLYVERFDETSAFYRDLLGYPVLTSWDRGPEDRGVMFDTGAGIVELLPRRGGPAPIQGCDLSLAVRDVFALWDALRDRAPVVHPLRHNPWGDTSFCIADPEGFRLTFFTPDRAAPPGAPTARRPSGPSPGGC